MYKFIRERHQEYAITENDIREVEERFEIVFPKILREFYLEHNGDIIRSSFFWMNGEKYLVHEMYYIKHPNAALEKVIQWDREDGYISEKMIPFAHDHGGESYYWNTEDEKVYFINGIDIENPSFVCDSIEEFFKILEEAEQF